MHAILKEKLFRVSFRTCCFRLSSRLFWWIFPWLQAPWHYSRSHWYPAISVRPILHLFLRIRAFPMLSALLPLFRRWSYRPIHHLATSPCPHMQRCWFFLFQPFVAVLYSMNSPSVSGLMSSSSLFCHPGVVSFMVRFSLGEVWLAPLGSHHTPTTTTSVAEKCEGISS